MVERDTQQATKYIASVIRPVVILISFLNPLLHGRAVLRETVYGIKLRCTTDHHCLSYACENRSQDIRLL